MPASGDVLLDTSVVIPYLKGDTAIGAQVQTSSGLYLPQTALGELYCGAHLSQNPGKHLAKIHTFLAAVAVLSPGVATAEHYDYVRKRPLLSKIYLRHCHWLPKRREANG